ncbi:MAG TPA: hypothetical protein PKC34_07875 [Pseudomonadales bacterium]|nr:hypothetical protein [Pseudomonadales bacterium]HMW84229.1 hypothetical protein [Pseudomonadales bacterium]HMY97887.1 hypothetical protein [Pseudomonadales bacterium]HMZ71868.1 hypothetical protein [Pseudomonadales bacterium]HNB84905.1 hypothetical protein [Pseudomonadales bacterium]
MQSNSASEGILRSGSHHRGHPMHIRWKTACSTIVLLSLSLGLCAAPKGGHGPAEHGHSATPPASSNRQSLPEAERGAERAQERQSEQAQEHSRAHEQQMEQELEQHKTQHSHGQGSQENKENKKLD